MKLVLPVAVGAAAVGVLAVFTPAQAAETESAVLTCGSASYVVTGFGRGTPLKLSSSNSNYIVKYARLEPSGQVVQDKPGTNLVECTTTSPSGQAYTFRGNFTPRR